MPDVDSTLADHLRQLEESFLRPEVRSSPQLSGALLHSDFVEFGSSGRIFDRAAILAELAAQADFIPPSIEDFRLQATGPGWALITYRAVRFPDATLRSSFWVQSGERWQMRFHQGTRQPSS